MPPTKLIRTALAAVGAGTVLAVVALPAAYAGDDGWQSAGKGKTAGISGIAVSGAGVADGDVKAVVVRDNKKPDENRIASVGYRDGDEPDVEPLDWKGGELPADLEALTAVPGEKGGHLAVTSSGTAYHLSVDGGEAKVVDTFELPAVQAGDEVENLTLGTVSPSAEGRDAQATAEKGKLTAVWGGRGEDDQPGTLHAALLTFDSAGRADFGEVQSAEVRAPYPEEDVRHASDTALTDSGDLLVSSASDPGDDGPFDSAVYAAGRVSLDDSGAVVLTVAKDPEVLKKFEKHKIEALACLPGTDKAILGTDDENEGGSLTTAGGLCGK